MRTIKKIRFITIFIICLLYSSNMNGQNYDNIMRKLDDHVNNTCQLDPFCRLGDTKGRDSYRTKKNSNAVYTIKVELPNLGPGVQFTLYYNENEKRKYEDDYRELRAYSSSKSKGHYTYGAKITRNEKDKNSNNNNSDEQTQQSDYYDRAHYYANEGTNRMNEMLNLDKMISDRGSVNYIPSNSNETVANNAKTNSKELVFILKSKNNEPLREILIGDYKDKPVYKKGDTIITYNNKYLLSKQTPLEPNDGYNSNYILFDENILQDGFLIELDIQGKREIIGYVTTTSRRSNSSLYGENENFAKTAENWKFKEAKCDEHKEIYKRFIAHCDKRIKMWDNTVNIFHKNINDYEKAIEEDRALNNKIIGLKAKDIVIQIIDDKIDDEIGDKTYNSIDLNTSIWDFAKKGTMNMLGKMLTDKKKIGNCWGTVEKALNAYEGNKVSKKLQNITVAQLLETEDEHLKDLYTSDLGKSLTETWHLLYDVLDDCTGGAAKALLIFKALPEAAGMAAIGAANLTIKYSVAPETRKMFEDHIQQARERRDYLIKFRNDCIVLLANNNKGECQGYIEVIHKIAEQSSNYMGHKHIADELNVLRKEIFPVIDK